MRAHSIPTKPPRRSARMRERRRNTSSEEASMEVSTVKAIVTGGASGLGRATAARVIAGGGRVAILDLARSAGADVARELGDRAAFVSTDVTSGDAVAGAVEQARAHLGGVNEIGRAHV